MKHKMSFVYDEEISNLKELRNQKLVSDLQSSNERFR